MGATPVVPASRVSSRAFPRCIRAMPPASRQNATDPVSNDASVSPTSSAPDRARDPLALSRDALSRTRVVCITIAHQSRLRAYARASIKNETGPPAARRHRRPVLRGLEHHQERGFRHAVHRHLRWSPAPGHLHDGAARHPRQDCRFPQGTEQGRASASGPESRRGARRGRPRRHVRLPRGSIAHPHASRRHAPRGGAPPTPASCTR